jgi:hypothetical protein
MKRAYALVVTVLLVAAGCVPESFLKKDDAAEKATSPVSRQPGKPHNFVRPDQVDENNCRVKEKMLREELEMDEQDGTAHPSRARNGAE